MKEFIKVLSEPITKLIDVASSGIGTLYKPRSIRKEADAKAYEIKTISRAQAEAASETRLIEAKTLDRINNRLVATEIRRQNNIDDIFEIAAKELVGATNISANEVDPDWATKFFNIVQDVSDIEMKEIWGKILSDEVKKPNSYSPRTLEVLRNLSKAEAQLFVKASSCFMKRDFIITESEFGLTLRDTMTLADAGLLNEKDYTKPFTHSTDYRDNEEVFYKIDTTKQIGISAKTLTVAGLELLKVIGQNPDHDAKIWRILAKSLYRHGAARVKKIKIIKWEEGRYYYDESKAEIL